MVFRNLLYILQTEGYRTGRFLRYAYSHCKWWKLENRQKLDWTSKAKLIYAISWALAIAAVFFSYLFFGPRGLFFIPLVVLSLPLLIALATVIVYPADMLLKKRLVQAAMKKFQSVRGDMTVIGITGSYGKTSMRQILASILAEKYKVMTLCDNINTDLGIARHILSHSDEIQRSEVFIVEMGAYQRGEIKSICDLVQPDYAILTGINETHLERFGSLENTIQAKFELPCAAKKKSALNFDDENVRNNYQRFSLSNAVGVTSGKAGRIKMLDNFAGLEFEVKNQVFRTKLLAEHNIVLILLGIEIAKALGMDLQHIADGVEKIEYIPHRLQPIRNGQTDVWIIDDSYNGNFNGIKSGLKVLSRAKGRKVVLTPGLVELGDKEKEIHKKIGNLYAEGGADLVLLVKNRVTPHIVEGMREKNFSNFHIYDSTQQAHADLANVLEPGDTIIFQNDWPDNYF